MSSYIIEVFWEKKDFSVKFATNRRKYIISCKFNFLRLSILLQVCWILTQSLQRSSFSSLLIPKNICASLLQNVMKVLVYRMAELEILSYRRHLTSRFNSVRGNCTLVLSMEEWAVITHGAVRWKLITNNFKFPFSFVRIEAHSISIFFISCAGIICCSS